MLVFSQMPQKSTLGLVWLQQQPVVPFHGTAVQDGSCCRLPSVWSLLSPCLVFPQAVGVSLKLSSDASKVPSVGIHGFWNHHVQQMDQTQSRGMVRSITPKRKTWCMTASTSIKTLFTLTLASNPLRGCISVHDRQIHLQLYLVRAGHHYDTGGFFSFS